MNPSLWLKFPDEVMFARRFTDDDKTKLESVFSTTDKSAPWLEALNLLKLQQLSNTPLIKWYDDAPYFNWSSMAEIISGGAIMPTKTDDGSYKFRSFNDFRRLGRLLSAQWHITKFLQRPAATDNKLAESIALGIALQSLILRLGPRVTHMPAWLAEPKKTPRPYRKIITQIQAIQMRRTTISDVWKDLFPADSLTLSDTAPKPDFFWDDQPPKIIPAVPTPSAENHSGPWKGLSVCAGHVTGLLVVSARNDTPEFLIALKEKYNAPLILLFRQARPETLEYFPYADALLFSEGGVLSHACTVAREMNIPAITGLGPDFYRQASAMQDKNLWLVIDGLQGSVSYLPVVD